MDIQLQRENPLEVGDSIQWLFNVISTDLEPGLYRLFVKLNATDRGVPLPGFADLRFEVRARTAENQPEILRREAARRLEKRDYEGAREAATELLKLHPNSAHAYGYLATIAEREGKAAEAARLRGRAEQIVKNNSDTLRLKYAAGRE